MVCPICSEYSHYVFTKYGFRIFECSDCMHQFVEAQTPESHVENVCGDHHFTNGGGACPGYLKQGEILRERGRWYAGVLAKHMQPGRVLDVGAAAGFVLSGFLEKGWRGIGIEPNDTMARYGREHLGIQVETGAFESFKTSEKFDLVSMLQVLPHFFDLGRALRTAADATAENGYWLVELWNRQSWTACFHGKHWCQYSPPSVVRWFAPYDLNLVAAKFGFEQVASGRPVRNLQGAHAKALLCSKFAAFGSLGKVASSITSVIPDNLQIPYPVQALHWALFQKVRNIDSASEAESVNAQAAENAAQRINHSRQTARR